MRITRIINNNVIVAVDDRGREMVLMGKGIGFQMKPGNETDPERVEKKFARFDEKQIVHFQRLAEEIPYEYMHMAMEIIDYAAISLNKELNENIYIALTDHLNFAINRIRQGIVLNNSMLWEIRHYYNHEYRIGLEAIAIIRRYTGVEMPEDEAGFIAMHILDSELDLDRKGSNLMTKIIQNTLNIVKYHFGLVIDADSLDYERFVMHLKFFIQRAIHQQESRIWDKGLMDMIRAQYLEAYECAGKVAAYIEKTTPYSVSEEEMVYLTVHIQRLQNASEKMGRVK